MGDERDQLKQNVGSKFTRRGGGGGGHSVRGANRVQYVNPNGLFCPRWIPFYAGDKHSGVPAD